MLLGLLQENLLCLLAFDDKRAPLIRNTIDIGLFGAQYKVIAARLYDYIDRYKKPPKAHLPDILDDKLHAENKREAGLFRDIVEAMQESREGINAEYVMAQLETFIKRQSMRAKAIDITKALQRDTEESLAEAEELFRGVQQSTLKLFDPGTRLDDKRALRFLESTATAFPIGIPEFDKRGFGPTRKEQFLFIANAKRGKTWFLIHLAKMAAIHRLKIAHVSLEMSEDRLAQRYYQALFAISKRKEVFKNTKFELDKLGRITGLDQVSVKPKFTLEDADIDEQLERKLASTAKRLLRNIFIKQFPTGQLTVPMLRSYLEMLEQNERFVPDVIVVDYPDLMKIDPANARLSIDQIYKDLRGIGVERNAAMVVVSQSHRSSANAKTVRSDNVAEAYSKIAHADVIITYSQTEAEHAMGLARLHVAGGRNDQDKLTLVISQQYALGQFAVDSVLMRGNYWQSIPKNGPDDEDDDQ